MDWKKISAPRDGGNAAAAALTIAIAIAIFALIPLFTPLLDSNLRFSCGDFSTMLGNESASIRKELSIYTFTMGSGQLYNNRFFLIGSLSALSDFHPFSDSQFHSAVILISLLLGSYGMHRLVRMFGPKGIAGAALVFCLIIFYFLNQWSMDRLVHIWIWFTYAIFPLFLALGLEHAESGSKPMLVAYSLLFGLFGAMPHSFLYLLIIHGIVVAFAAMSGKSRRDVLALALIPAAIYLLLNLPALSLFRYMQEIYPVSIDAVEPSILSNNGRLSNFFTFSNNWWPLVPQKDILENGAFRISGIMIFAGSIILLCAAYPRLEGGRKILAMLSLSAIIGAAFISQGVTSSILSWGIAVLSDAGLGELLGVFREWARMSIMAPVFISLLSIVCLPALKKRESTAFLCAFLSFIAINAASSPGRAYLEGRCTTMQAPADLSAIAALVSGDYKALWAGKEAPERNYFDISKYGGLRAGLGDRMAFLMPDRMLDDLGISHIIFRKDDAGFGVLGRGDLSCSTLGRYEVCQRNASRIHVFAGTVFTNGDAQKMLSLSALPENRYAPSSGEFDRSAFVLFNASDGAGSMFDEEALQGKMALYAIEAEEGLSGAEGGRYLAGADYSGGGILILPEKKPAYADVYIAKDGKYRLAVRGRGLIGVGVGNESFEFNENALKFGYSDPILLKKGIIRIWVSGEGNASLDVVWIYEDVNNAGLADILGANDKSAAITSCRQVNPTLWIADVNATGPFVLGFAETYSPYWEARIFRGGNRVGTAEPIELYGAMNGFWIEEAGDLEIELRYAPQDTYEAALALSAITFASCLAYVFVPRLMGVR